MKSSVVSSSLIASERDTVRDRRLVSAWLFTIAGMIFVMIVLGGATRLTGSGLSIMEWAPVTGALPPWSHAEWERLFALYKQIPQYSLVNSDFSLGDFKQIFWLEWVHRFWGRLIGAAVLLPLAFFWVTGRLSRPLLLRLGLIFILGALQGAVGWFMVASGFFPEATAVSPYRLVVHLTLALALYAAVLWTALDTASSGAWPLRAGDRAPPGTLAVCGTVAALVALTIVAGGFVAGLHAGLDYNTFPLMGGRWVPEGYARLHPFALNLTENVAAVQFNHRLLASLTALASLGCAAWLLSRAQESALRIWAVALGCAVLVQFGLGVLTLLHAVPPALGIAHQAGAVLLLTAALGCLHAAPRRRSVRRSA